MSFVKKSESVSNVAPPTAFQRFLSTLRTGCTNKYGRVVVYAIACLTTSCLYFGWQQYSEMLFRNGAYEWLCTAESEVPEEGLALCVDQDKAITRLYSLANGSEFVSAAIGGVLLDHLGPRYTALLGETLFLVAVLLVAFSSRKFQAYIPGLILSGVCVNIISFPSLTVIESWPSRQALAVSIIVGAQSGASVIAPILISIWNKHPEYQYAAIWGVYLVAVWVPVTLFYIWALPTRRDYAALVQETPETPETPRPLLTTEDSDKHTVDLAEKEHAEAAQGVCASSSSSSAEELDDEDFEPPTSPEKHAIEVGAEPDSAVNLDPLVVPEMTSEKQVWRAFWRDVRTVDLIVMAVYFLLQMLQFAYYPSIVRDAVSLRISDYVGWMTPLQAVFSIVIGFIMDYTGTCLVMFGMSATLIFVSLSVGYGAERLALQYAVGIVFVFMQSATYNLKFTFVNEMYDPFNFGKLVGLLGVMGGVGVYINTPISSSTNYKLVFTIYVAVAAFMAVCTTFIFVRQRQGVTHKTLEGIKQKNRGAKQPASNLSVVEPEAAEQV
eukprot:Gregarina_sp_Pseudo_9__5783@NODE_863_length_2121_cov_326_570125_g811_i0_p1_GENE_NODE_863_length_2121_cov_326_570125_g811_i0NODE_863_length_2121_cov_326_570125_g811_i0_p1_ORF_typecomplete_len552_score160_60MFS_1/PF07690_16/7_2e02MFS_1/PF07690_16/3_1e23MFS_1/PF07690_16/5_2e07Sugar_tr/PF00083_24/1_3e18MFS_4/PF06779_14/0_0002MFS_4/PF06779_14/1_8e04MtrD/PF04207_12/0_071MtrD/PF04207_12/1_1e02Phage_holin_3_1/PF05106_12/0_85Phage_holin_3_1/PF05106_12/66Phage_holin_3_1/PF05106_12/3_1e03_NODE_863_length_2